jgi:hypothetical protein
MPPKKTINKDSFIFTKTSDTFSSMLTQFIKVKEGYPYNHEYQWSAKDIKYVRAALDEMTPDQRNVFRKSIQNYQITKEIFLPNQGSA